MTGFCAARKPKSAIRGRGFSLIEMMVVLLVLGIVCGALYEQLASVQQRARTEQVKLDYMQEARDFSDQFFRDANQAGFPSARLIDTASPLWVPPLQAPLKNDHRLAAGLVKADANEIWFEGDIAGTGNVQTIVYKINGSGTCPQCLQRSQVNKVDGDPITAQTPVWGTEINQIVNNAVFSYYQMDGTQITALPVDINSAPATIASIKTIRISIRLTNANVVDPKTRQPIEMIFEGEVSLNNCSLAANGQPMSCF
ncbi:MAG TPA: type II secretion system protein [Alphaproteobacteria bacterium]|nr:type II secretion system protein [Alphaproteobacteria bacterium]